MEQCYTVFIILNCFLPILITFTFHKTVKEWELFFFGEERIDQENVDLSYYFNLLSIFIVLIQTHNILQYYPSLLKSTIWIISGIVFLNKKEFFFKLLNFFYKALRFLFLKFLSLTTFM